MRKNEWILVGIVLIAAIGFFAARNMLFNTDGDKVLITIDGKEYASLDLNKDTIFEIKGKESRMNQLEIKDGIARMIDATCPDLLCVHQSPIHKNKEMLVCLPNRVVVEVKSNKGNDVDMLVN